MKLVIKGARVVDYRTNLDDIMDIAVEDGKIVAVQKNIDANNAEVIDASNKLVMAGLVDMHCHLRDPGYEYKEDISSGSLSAAKGGFTSIVAMPNTSPVVDNKAVATYVVNTAKMMGKVHVYQTGAISKGLKGVELAEMEDMKAAGIVAVTDDGKPVENSALFRKALMYANMFELPVISHSEDLSIVDGGSMNESFNSTLLGMRGIPSVGEEIAISRDIMLAEYSNAPIHITHISTAGSVRIIKEAKARGVKVTCDTCPQYFTLTDDAVLDFNTNTKANPPIRSEFDRLAIIEGIKDGTIDAIATDHAPHHIDDKNVEYDHAANGMIGFETAFSLANEILVKAGHISYTDLSRLMCNNPAKLLKLPAGGLEVGAAADITIFDTDISFEYKEEDIVSRSKNSPFIGRTLVGKAEKTIVSGNVVTF